MKEYKGYFTFYLIPEGDGKTSSDRVEVKVGSDLINAGEIDLANIGQEKVSTSSTTPAASSCSRTQPVTAMAICLTMARSL